MGIIRRDKNLQKNYIKVKHKNILVMYAFDYTPYKLKKYFRSFYEADIWSRLCSNPKAINLIDKKMETNPELMNYEYLFLNKNVYKLITKEGNILNDFFNNKYICPYLNDDISLCLGGTDYELRNNISYYADEKSIKYIYQKNLAEKLLDYNELKYNIYIGELHNPNFTDEEKDEEEDIIYVNFFFDDDSDLTDEILEYHIKNKIIKKGKKFIFDLLIYPYFVKFLTFSNIERICDLYIEHKLLTSENICQNPRAIRFIEKNFKRMAEIDTSGYGISELGKNPYIDYLIQTQKLSDKNIDHIIRNLAGNNKNICNDEDLKSILNMIPKKYFNKYHREFRNRERLKFGYMYAITDGIKKLGTELNKLINNNQSLDLFSLYNENPLLTHQLLFSILTNNYKTFSWFKSSSYTRDHDNDRADYWCFRNPEIYEIDYQEIAKLIESFKEELIQKCFHPKRLVYYLEKYNYDIGCDEFNSL